ncbi:Wzz/FepE/Etk N-terminal domain-containing protein [Rhodococcus sp. CSLK01-03]|uniref:Wzz/FepE/Etk N-terminal domain-containing protein n=1 Tax=Rhodococcus indonesiensis TaxID=3055869 RepID=A0ABT7RGU0_9NOCA|nr:polysaccharide biosynthesis tyrosine autokinase [Rhodococcus indonesiensis]MDM7486857.1 Wzz/FepE/Etk N-terminal domain-containing protein [Rhodococcus indonesiensis]
MALSDYTGIVRRRWLIVVATVLACTALAWAYASTIPTVYVSTTRMYVSMATGTSVNDSYQGGLAAQQRITSYPYVATGATVAERVVDRLGLTMSPGELQGKVSATFPPATTLLDISVTDSTPEGARRLSRAVSDEFAQLVAEMETTVIGAAPAARASVIDPAPLPGAPVGPNTKRILALGVIAGLGLGFLLAFLRDRFDPTIRTPQQLGRSVRLPVLGTISRRNTDAAKDIGHLRAQITAARGDRDRMVVMLTSFTEHSNPCVAARLAKALADTGARVALIDADTSGEGVTGRLDMQSYPGVAEWLRDQYPPLTELPVWSEAGVSVLPLGSADERTPDLLASDRFAGVLSGLGEHFDYVFVAAAPVLTDAAALSLSAHCDATIAVVELGTTKAPRLQAAADSFAKSGTGLVGAVATVPARTRRFPQPKKLRRTQAEPDLGLAYSP